MIFKIEGRQFNTATMTDVEFLLALNYLNSVKLLSLTNNVARGLGAIRNRKW